MNQDYKKVIIEKIIEKEDRNQCWNVLENNNPHAAELNYYIPKYDSTLWTLIFIADLGIEYKKARFKKPLSKIGNCFYKKDSGIFTLGRSHFPIPCLNGNMIYLYSYFGLDDQKKIESTIQFFNKYQRFDDGDYKTPKEYPYHSNKSCYGKHSCYWGVIKLLKGISFIPIEKRSNDAKELREKCVDYILKHSACFSSHDRSKYIRKNIDQLTVPNMYESSIIEILWLLMREKVNAKELKPSIRILKDKKRPDGSWSMERTNKKLIIPFGERSHANELITERVKEIVDYYESMH